MLTAPAGTIYSQLPATTSVVRSGGPQRWSKSRVTLRGRVLRFEFGTGAG
ncbi:hypothetical protein [Arthrobacter bambusae]|nr:hypothetical protein [Arthrobacter bambusae]MDQ0028263.1 hypothetical protein [Arthrobacter bambusae]MDQ0096943.1 hypothetical protein [Arthrobacter bambusae]